VTIADRIWLRTDVEPSQEWLDLLVAHHGVDVQPLDFASDPDNSRRSINGWIEEQTQGLITDLLPDGSIQPLTVLVPPTRLTWGTVASEDRQEP
jgi:serine protease inhibitor